MCKLKALALMLLAVIVAPLLAGCATSATPSAMTLAAPAPTQTATTATAAKPAAKSIDVLVSGSPAGLEAADFKLAVEASLESAGLRRGPDGAAAEYQLVAQIIELERPFAIARITANLEVAWSLLRKSDNSVVFRKVISSTHTGGAFDSLAGLTRARMAVEAAAKNNIEMMVTDLAGLKP
jgi:ABC-type uncharacterized transport system auxiliary subunit